MIRWLNDWDNLARLFQISVPYVALSCSSLILYIYHKSNAQTRQRYSHDEELSDNETCKRVHVNVVSIFTNRFYTFIVQIIEADNLVETQNRPTKGCSWDVQKVVQRRALRRSGVFSYLPSLDEDLRWSSLANSVAIVTLAIERLNDEEFRSLEGSSECHLLQHWLVGLAPVIACLMSQEAQKDETRSVPVIPGKKLIGCDDMGFTRW